MLYMLDPDNPSQGFPDAEEAEREPDGLLAVGGDLSPPRLLDAYRNGIFPWYAEGQPILWWSPDPRTVLFPDRVRISRSLRKTLRKGLFQVSFDQVFPQVIRRCAGPRRDDMGTWILPEMMVAYETLHELGHAHSVEVWQDAKLVGGLYGVAVGKAFFGESMFSLANDASKVGLVALCEHLRHRQFALIDCQVRTDHLIRMGATEIPRRTFLSLLARARRMPDRLPWAQPALPFLGAVPG